MTSNIDRIVQQAYQLIDAQPDYKIPKLEQWKRQNDPGIKKVSACQGCGKPILHSTDKKPIKCKECRKKVSDLFRKRTKNKLFKETVI